MDIVNSESEFGETVPSQKGKSKLCLNGYLYNLTRDNDTGTRSYWRCERRTVCRGKAITARQNDSGYHLVIKKNEHNHGPPHKYKKIAEVVAELRRQARETDHIPAKIIHDVTSVLSAETQALLPSKSALRQQICRARKVKEQEENGVALLQQGQLSQSSSHNEGYFSDHFNVIPTDNKEPPAENDKRYTNGNVDEIAEQFTEASRGYQSADADEATYFVEFCDTMNQGKDGINTRTDEDLDFEDKVQHDSSDDPLLLEPEFIFEVDSEETDDISNQEETPRLKKPSQVSWLPPSRPTIEVATREVAPLRIASKASPGVLPFPVELTRSGPADFGSKAVLTVQATSTPKPRESRECAPAPPVGNDGNSEDLFGRFVASTLSSIRPESRMDLAKLEIMQVLIKYKHSLEVSLGQPTTVHSEPPEARTPDPRSS